MTHPPTVARPYTLRDATALFRAIDAVTCIADLRPYQAQSDVYLALWPDDLYGQEVLGAIRGMQNRLRWAEEDARHAPDARAANA